jgi:hypothetical protein
MDGVPPCRGGATQGRRFNGRPAVSKTASGGSNPSAPANHPAYSWERGKEDLWLIKVWFQDTKDYFNELKLEMRRVTWPNRKQVEGTTAVVIPPCSPSPRISRWWTRSSDEGVKAVLEFFTK